MGIDIGTSGCKAAAIDKNGKELAISYREYDVIFPKSGGAELDSVEVIRKCLEVIKECTSKAGNNQVNALAISSQGEAFTAIGDDGRILSNAMVSSDKRALPALDKILNQIDGDKLYTITGHTAHPMFTLFKLKWFKDNKPDVWNKTAKFLCFEDLLQFFLGLDPAISWSLAGRTMLFDVRKHEWSGELLVLLKIDESRLARPLPAGAIAGTVNSEIASRLGLAPQTIVVGGGHDQICNALGAGAVEGGKAIYANGTVDCITPCFEKPIFSSVLKEHNLCAYDHAVPGNYATVAFSLTGGNILKWFRDEFAEHEKAMAQNTNRDVYEIILDKMWDKPSNLLVLPYFSPSGTPYFDTDTKGAILGLRLSTKKGEVIRALLEGGAFEMRLNLNILENAGYKITDLRVVGGGAKSNKWSQLKADVIGKRVSTLNVSEAGCLGAAMLACSAREKIKVEHLAKEWVQIDRTFKPKPEKKKFYDDKFEKYKALYQIVKSIHI